MVLSRHCNLPFHSLARSSAARVFDIFFITVAIFNLALAITTIRDVVSESIRQAAKRRRRRAARNKLRREQTRANPRPHEFVYHGGGRRVNANDDLHAATPSAGMFTIAADALRFGRRRKMNDDSEDDNDSYLELDPYEADRILEEDQHLIMPRVADPDLDAEYRKEVEYHDRRDRILQVRAVHQNITSACLIT